MEFSIEVSGQSDTGGALTAPAPDPTALQTAQTELKDIMTNPSNPRHAGFHRGDAGVSQYLESLYKKATSPTTQPEAMLRSDGSPEEEPTLSAADVQAWEDLSAEWGADAPSHWADAQLGIRRLAGVLGGEIDDLSAAVLAAGGDLKMVVNIARHFGKHARTYTP